MYPGIIQLPVPQFRNSEQKPKEKLEIEPSKIRADPLRVDASLKTENIGKEVLTHHEFGHCTDEDYGH